MHFVWKAHSSYAQDILGFQICRIRTYEVGMITRWSYCTKIPTFSWKRIRTRRHTGI